MRPERHRPWRHLGNAHRFVSRLAAARFLGYLNAQKTTMTGGRGAHANRPELAATHGYDTKHAMHALRLGLQGIELLTTGRITLPVPEPDRGYLRAIRSSEVPLAEVVDAVTRTETRLAKLRIDSKVPAEPDRRWVDDWLHRSYLSYWERLVHGHGAALPSHHVMAPPLAGGAVVDIDSGQR